MRSLYTLAALKADEVRMDFDLDMFQPVNVFDICVKLGIELRFVGLNMEGMYFNSGDGKSLIILSNQRPLPRRQFTCAHELGHHLFGHGTKADELVSGDPSELSSPYEERLVDAFAGLLLMPIAGIESEFAKRDLQPQLASPIEFFTISSVFGVGYNTLITHCKANRIIDSSKADALKKWTPKKILHELSGKSLPATHFKIVDDLSPQHTIDLEIANHLFLPVGYKVEGSLLARLGVCGKGTLYTATTTGIARVTDTCGTSSHFIRVQRQDYEGLAEYRHLSE